MCPAFGSLRVGLRMKRVATVLSGSACCVYGLTFVSHFYGARRSVGYVPFNSETLVTGKLFEDIRDAVHELADPDRYDAIVVTNLCVPTASGVPLRLLPDEINGVRIVGIDVPGFRRPDPCRGQGRAGRRDAELRPQGDRGRPGRRRPARRKSDRPTVTLLGEMFPADPMMIGAMLAPLGLAAGRSCPAANGASFMPRSIAARWPRSTRSTPPRCASSRPRAARRGLGPVGRDGTAAWLPNIGDAFGVAADKVAEAQNAFLPAIKGALAAAPIKGTITLSGYEGSELLVARLLIESGADVPYVGTACPKTPNGRPTANGSRRRASRSSSAPRWKTIAPRWRRSSPIWPSAPRRWCRRPRSWHPGALLHQPDLRPAADGSGGRRQPGAGGQCRHRQQGPHGPHEGLLRGRRHRATPPASGKAIRTCAPISAPRTRRSSTSKKAQEMNDGAVLGFSQARAQPKQRT
jgi:chlorophyllide reductase subunit Y